MLSYTLRKLRTRFPTGKDVYTLSVQCVCLEELLKLSTCCIPEELDSNASRRPSNRSSPWGKKACVWLPLPSSAQQFTLLMTSPLLRAGASSLFMDMSALSEKAFTGIKMIAQVLGIFSPVTVSLQISHRSSSLQLEQNRFTTPLTQPPYNPIKLFSG